MSLQRLLRDWIIRETERAAKEALRPLPFYLRRLGGGIFFLYLAAVAGNLGLIALASALFFAIASLPFAIPALWVALACALASMFLALLGVRLLRPPR
jgi:hypothetical protein